MGKGKDKGSREQQQWQPREVGTYWYLKNYRRGLLHQMGRCQSDIIAATARGDSAAGDEAHGRLWWIVEKQRRLDQENEMVFDKPSWHNGRELPYGGLQDNARRFLTPQEIDWNESLIFEEGAAPPRASRGTQTVSSAPVAATASTLGSESAGSSATPAVPRPSTSRAAGAETPATRVAATSPTPGYAVAPGLTPMPEEAAPGKAAKKK